MLYSTGQSNSKEHPDSREWDTDPPPDIRKVKEFVTILNPPYLGYVGNKEFFLLSSRKKRDKADCVDCLGTGVTLSFWHGHLNVTFLVLYSANLESQG